MPIIITHTENCTRVKQGHRHPITAPRGLAFCLPKSLRLPCRNLPPLFHNILTLRSNSRRHIHTTLRRPCHCSSAPHVLPPPLLPLLPLPRIRVQLPPHQRSGRSGSHPSWFSPSPELQTCPGSIHISSPQQCRSKTTNDVESRRSCRRSAPQVRDPSFYTHPNK